MNKFLKNIDVRFLLVGIFFGGIGGYSYYYFIGCNTGSCPITSNPVIMTLYGIFFGMVLFFKKKKKTEGDDN